MAWRGWYPRGVPKNEGSGALPVPQALSFAHVALLLPSRNGPISQIEPGEVEGLAQGHRVLEERVRPGIQDRELQELQEAASPQMESQQGVTKDEDMKAQRSLVACPKVTQVVNDGARPASCVLTP